MSASFDPAIAQDVHVLLRADAERRWLHREVMPVLRQLEAREQLPEDQIEAALAYLEATWDEARVRAHATDSAHTDLQAPGNARDALREPADRYHAAVRVLRGTLAERVTPFIEPAIEAISYASAHGRSTRL